MKVPLTGSVNPFKETLTIKKIPLYGLFVKPESFENKENGMPHYIVINVFRLLSF